MKKPDIRDNEKAAAPAVANTELKSPRSSLRWILLVPFIILLGVVAAIVRGDQKSSVIKPIAKAKITNGSDKSEATIKKMVRNNIHLYVKAETNDYDHKGLGGISNLEITVNNPTDYTIDKVRVKITYIKANGGVYETKYEDFLWMRPTTRSTHRIPDTKRGTSVKCEVSVIKSKALGL